MNTLTDPKPVKSTEITFDSDREYEKFIKYVEDPPEPSQFVKDLITGYRNMVDVNSDSSSASH